MTTKCTSQATSFFDLEQWAKEEKIWLDELLESLVPWDPYCVPQRRLAWLRCEGIPVNLWTRDCFESISQHLGALVRIDPLTTSFSRLDHARFGITTSLQNHLFSCRWVRLNKKEFSVRLVEEIVPQEMTTSCCSQTSSEVESESTDVVDSFSSEGGVEEDWAEVGSLGVGPDHNLASLGVGRRCVISVERGKRF